MSDSFFIHPQHRKSIVTIYPATTLQVQVDDATQNARKQAFTISVDQLTPANLLQIRLCDCRDASRMLVSTIDAVLFEQIKHDQSLNVSFIDFVQHLQKILDSAAKRNDLHATLTTVASAASPGSGTLQFYERRSFRNLVHLSLPIEQPTERFVLHYIQLALADAQQLADAQALQLQRAQHELTARDAQLAELRSDLAKSSARLRDEEARQQARNADQQHRLQTELQRAAEAREADDHRHRHTIKTLQDTLDRKTNEAQQLAERLAQDALKATAVRDELQLARQQLRHGQEEADRLRTDCAALKAHDRQTEHAVVEQRQQLHELGERLQAHEKQRSEMQAELEAEKHIARTKRLALELATEEISRANSIIVRQAKELGQLAKKCEWRTEVALRQEQRIAAMEAEREELRATVRAETETNKENADVSGQLRQLRDATDEINRKYARKIHDLRQQLEQVNVGARLNDYTNRYTQLTARSDKR